MRQSYCTAASILIIIYLLPFLTGHLLILLHYTHTPKFTLNKLHINLYNKLVNQHSTLFFFLALGLPLQLLWVFFSSNVLKRSWFLMRTFASNSFEGHSCVGTCHHELTVLNDPPWCSFKIHDFSRWFCNFLTHTQMWIDNAPCKTHQHHGTSDGENAKAWRAAHHISVNIWLAKFTEAVGSMSEYLCHMVTGSSQMGNSGIIWKNCLVQQVASII